MKSFLEYVAEDILKKFGTKLSRIAVVFPNKRASLFLNEHLARLSHQPLWSPVYITISDLFRSHSSLQVADPIKLVCDLHHVFTEVTGTDETLDHFYGWGQLLLADFDDIDKNMAPPYKVFAHLRDIHELDDVSYLTEEQKQVLQKFFSNFSDEHNTELKERFLRLWSKMGDIYQAFNRYLLDQGLAYEGALYRQVVTSENITFDYDAYLFVGFNVLQEVEQKLFSTIRQQGKAFFYWDFDHYYMDASSGKKNEAGHYIGQYQTLFPNQLDSSNADNYNQFSQPKDITFISASTENIQARYISTWLSQHQRVLDGHRTAIVLCNESLLPTVLHALPDEVDKVNITTGYPLSQSPVASFISQLLALRINGFSTSRNQFRLYHVGAVLRHPYAAYLSAESGHLYQQLVDSYLYYPDSSRLSIDQGTSLLFAFATPDNSSLLTWLCKVLQGIAQKADISDPLFQESVFRAYSLINRLKTLVDSGDLKVDVITLQRLIAQLVASTTIPFHGEPAEGLQVMGVLETRNIDFDHVLLLSCNEGNMPRGVNDTSFIPYSIRKSFSLTTIDHKVSIYSYYFHRLLQRAGDITILYNNATTEGQTGEMSRFMLQLMVESPHHIHFKTLQAGQHLRLIQRPIVEKTPDIINKLMQQFSTAFHTDECRPLLTPTAINRYMRCQLQFYYHYVCGLKEPDTTDTDSIDNRLFGNIFHEASRMIYNRLLQRDNRILATDLERLLKDRIDIERAVDEAIKSELFHSPTMLPLNGLQIINREVIIQYLRLLLQQDLQLAPFTIIGVECDVVKAATFKSGNDTFQTTLGGRIDRLDQITDENNLQRIRVIDYKTGNIRINLLPDVEAVFQPENIARHSDYYLQTILYACLVRKSQQFNPSNLSVSPALLFIQHSANDPILRFGQEPVNDVAACSRQFALLLKERVEEIFNPSIAFTPTDFHERCAMCPYKQICRI